MRLQLPQQIDKKQWLNRLGYTAEVAEKILDAAKQMSEAGAEVENMTPSAEDARLLQQMETAEQKLLGAAMPQGVYRVMELGWNRNNESEGIPVMVTEKGAGLLKSKVMELPGAAIKKHLAECNGMIIMAVTLGAGVDRLIRTAQIRDMAEAVLMDSGASILAEQCADILEETIRAESGGSVKDRYTMSAGGAAGCCDDADTAGARNCGAAPEQGQAPRVYFTGRYSPGYGDFPIEMQKTLLQAVDGPKSIGLTSNESSILIPRKSITAIIGTANHPVSGYLATCDECTIRDNCRLRAEGTFCYK